MERKKIIVHKENLYSQDLYRLTGVCPKVFLEQLNIPEPISLENLKLLSEFMEFNFVSPNLFPEENLIFFSKTFPDRSKKVVISIMGHVNHGKTTIIDRIRNSKIAQNEAGGITQNVSFYNIKYSNESFILIDTPGRAAFSGMRQTIADVSDIIVLIVAAEDGVQEQTREIARNIKNKHVIICINKIDKGEKNLSRIYGDLANLNIVSKNFGGEVETVLISAHKGVDDLLDAIVHEIQKKKIKNDHRRFAIGTVVDANIKEGIGVIVEILIQEGIVNVKDYFMCEGQIGRIKTIISNNKQLQTCEATEIISIVGFNSIPAVGSKMFVIPDISFRDFFPNSLVSSSKTYEKDQHFICKSDQESKLKTLTEFVARYGNIIDSSIGVLKKNELDQAKTFKAILIIWQKMPNSFVSLLSQYPDVKYIQDEVIYQIQEQIEKLNEKPAEEKLIESGTLKVIKTFFIKGKNIAGCKVINGKVEIGSKCIVKRNETEIIWAKIDSLQKEKQDIEEARKGTECGIILRIERATVDKFEEGDEIIAFAK